MERPDFTCIACLNSLREGDQIVVVEECQHLLHEGCSGNTTGTCPVDEQVFDVSSLCSTSAVPLPSSMVSRYSRLMFAKTNTHSQRNIAWIFSNERDDEEKVVKWLQKAVDGIDPSPNAMLDLAERHRTGKSSMLNLETADRYRRMAMSQIESLQRKNSEYLGIPFTENKGEREAVVVDSVHPEMPGAATEVHDQDESGELRKKGIDKPRQALARNGLHPFSSEVTLQEDKILSEMIEAVAAPPDAANRCQIQADMNENHAETRNESERLLNDGADSSQGALAHKGFDLVSSEVTPQEDRMPSERNDAIFLPTGNVPCCSTVHAPIEAATVENPTERIAHESENLEKESKDTSEEALPQGEADLASSDSMPEEVAMPSDVTEVTRTDKNELLVDSERREPLDAPENENPPRSDEASAWENEEETQQNGDEILEPPSLTRMPSTMQTLIRQTAHPSFSRIGETTPQHTLEIPHENRKTHLSRVVQIVCWCFVVPVIGIVLYPLFLELDLGGLGKSFLGVS